MFHPNQDLSDAESQSKKSAAKEISVKEPTTSSFKVDHETSKVDMKRIRNSDKKTHLNMSASNTDLVYSKITGQQDTLLTSRQKMEEEEMSENNGRGDERKAPMFMMFQKVEAGKQVAETLFRVQRNKENETLQVEEQRVEIMKDGDSKQANYRETKKPLKSDQKLEDKQKSAMHQNLLGQQQIKQSMQKRQALPPQIPSRFDWERNYSMAMIARTKDATNDILETCNQIEKATSSSQDIHRQREREVSSDNFSGRPNIKYYQRSVTNPQLMSEIETQMVVPVSESRMFENITPLIIDVETHPNQQRAQKRSSLQYPLSSMHHYQNRALIPKPLPQPLVKTGKAVSYQTVQRIESSSPKHSKKQNIMIAYGLSFPKIAAATTLSNLQPTRVRPQSSRPPLHVNYNTTTTQGPPLSNSKSSQMESDKHRLQSAKTAAKVPNHVKKAPNGGGGLLDFNNMTDENIKEIASKADQLIEIIQNIKDKVGGGSHPKNSQSTLPDNIYANDGNGEEPDKAKDGWW